MLNLTNRTGKVLSIRPSFPFKASAKRERRHCDAIQFRATTDEQHNLVITADQLWRMFKKRIQEGNQLQAYTGAQVCVLLCSSQAVLQTDLILWSLRDSPKIVRRKSVPEPYP